MENNDFLRPGVTNVTTEEPLRTHMDKVGAIYYHRRVVPLELRPYLLTKTGKPRTEFKTSLQTKDRKEADRRLEIEDVKITRLFDAARRKLEAGVPPSVTDSIEQELEQEQAKLGQQERERFEALEAQVEHEFSALLAEEAEDGVFIESLNRPASELTPEQRMMRRNLPAAYFDPKVREAEERTFRKAWDRGAVRAAADFAGGRLGKDAVSPKLMDLFGEYVRRNKPKPATRKRWRPIMEKLCDYLGHDDVRRISATDIVQWRDDLLAGSTTAGSLTPKTVGDTYLAAVKAVIVVAEERGIVAENVAKKVVMPPAKKSDRQKVRDFSNAEVVTILKASYGPYPERLSLENRLARRWVPWVCAYTGARVNEITQLRQKDIVQRDGVWCIHITPDAGSVKTDEERTVPLHPHLIEQGFHSLAVAGSDRPIFYDPSRGRGGNEANPHHKKVGERLAAWVRSIGVKDKAVQPNHAWRHLMKTRGREAGMEAGALDNIMGHAPRTEGGRYGTYTIATLKREVNKLPRFEID